MIDTLDATIKQLLRSNSLPIWPENRPAVLVWLVIDDGTERSIVAGEHRADAAQQLKDAAAARGVTLALPMGDLEDRMALVLGNADPVIGDRQPPAVGVAMGLDVRGIDFKAMVDEFAKRMPGIKLLANMTEFGRTARPNGTRGTDHGTAAPLFCSLWMPYSRPK